MAPNPGLDELPPDRWPKRADDAAQPELPEVAGPARLLAGLALGALSGVLFGFAALGSRPQPRGAALHWVADRDAGRVVGLDVDFFEVAAFPARAPLFVETRRDQRLWIADAVDAAPLSPTRVALVTPQGVSTFEVELGPLSDFETLEHADALALEATDAKPRIVRILEGQPVCVVASESGLQCVAGRAERVVAGTADGWLLAFQSDGRGAGPVARFALGGTLVDIAPAPGGWWVLDAQGGAQGARLIRCGDDLEPLWQVATSVAALSLIADYGRERVWLADTNESSLRRFGPTGALELVLPELPAAGLDRGVALQDGGALLVAPGALLHVDALGALLPGQGGFDFLVDAATAPILSPLTGE